MTHRGEILKAVLNEQKVNKTWLAKKLNRVPNTIHNYLADPGLKWDIIAEIGKIIKHDFTQNFPDMPVAQTLNEPSVAYGINLENKISLSECLAKFDNLRSRYISLLEEYTRLQETHITMLRKFQ